MSGLPAYGDDLIALLCREPSNMRFFPAQTKLHLEPEINRPCFHAVVSLKGGKGTMCQDPLVPEVPVCQRSHRQQAGFVGAYIGITGGPVGAKIEISAFFFQRRTIDHAGWAQDRPCLAIRTFNLNSVFFHEIISPPLVPIAAGLRLLS